ncbi:uncharacterized protein LOC127872836 isoform X1 [Dreissena polymorpha]|uniref:uncharacterized protein LOC127872836 isoform X1 n=1 Tax=Dreissena polymorpha TaxID=45954 RepID=UPI0022643F9E|nr:uncharacterized protein LOC127872836 isoform X1 [Dreissena polymorpha]
MVDVLDGMKVGNMTTNQNDAYIFDGPITWNNDRFFVFSNSDNEMQHKRMTDDESESVLCNRPGTHVEEDKNYSDPVLSPNELPRDEQKTCVDIDENAYKINPSELQELTFRGRSSSNNTGLSDKRMYVPHTNIDLLESTTGILFLAEDIHAL